MQAPPEALGGEIPGKQIQSRKPDLSMQSLVMVSDIRAKLHNNLPSKFEAHRCFGRQLEGNLGCVFSECKESSKKWKTLSTCVALVLCMARNSRCALSGSSSSSGTTWPNTSSLIVVSTLAGSSKDLSRPALRSTILRSVSMFLWAVSTSLLNDRLPPFSFFTGLRRSPPQSSDVRLEGAVDVATFMLDLGSPQSRSGRESESESELRTTCSPLETIRLLAPELAEFCDGCGGAVSKLVAIVAVGDVVVIVEGFVVVGRVTSRPGIGSCS